MSNTPLSFEMNGDTGTSVAKNVIAIAQALVDLQADVQSVVDAVVPRQIDFELSRDYTRVFIHVLNANGKDHPVVVSRIREAMYAVMARSRD